MQRTLAKARRSRGRTGLLALAIGSVSVHANAATVSKIPVAPASSSLDPAFLTVRGNAAYFVTHGTGGDLLLWTSDGTAAGTVVLKSIAGANTFTSTQPQLAATIDAANTLLLVVDDAGNARHTLWRTDGTANGTTMVAVMPADPVHTSPTVVYYAAARVGAGGARAVFIRRTVVSGKEWIALLSSDGTAAGTVDLNTAVGNHEFTTFGDAAYFVGADGNLRRTDGQTVTLGPTFADRDPAQISMPLVACNGYLYLTYRRSGLNAWPLMRYDGTSTPTEATPTEPGFPQSPVCAGSDLFFFKTTAASGTEPWVVDGTGAHQVADIVAGSGGSKPSGFPFGSRLLLRASIPDLSNDDHWAAYISNPSNNGVTKLLDTTAPFFPVGEVGGQYYFQTDLLTAARALHATDGNNVTTVSVGGVPFPIDPAVTLGSKLVSTLSGSGAPALWVLESGSGSGGTTGDGGTGDGGKARDAGKNDGGQTDSGKRDGVGAAEDTDDDANGSNTASPSGDGEGALASGCDVAMGSTSGSGLLSIGIIGAALAWRRRRARRR